MKKPIYIEVVAEVLYWEKSTFNGVEDTSGKMTPFRRGDLWCPVIRLSDGQVQDWPQDTSARIHYKVCDAGEYWLLDADHRRIAKWGGYYVPDDFLCQGGRGFGDYIILNIDGHGKVTNWKVPAVTFGTLPNANADWLPISDEQDYPTDPQ